VSRYSALRYAVRFRVVGKYLSQLFGVLALLLLVPGLLAGFGGETQAALSYLVISIILATAALAGRMLPEPETMQRNEAAAVVSLLFVCSSFLLTLPIMSYGVSFADAWFEAVSGVTTTGLSTIDLTGKPVGFLFARAWSQWIGGIGVVVLALAVLMRSGHAASNLGFGKQEMGNAVGGTRAHARRVVVVYLSLTAAGISALWLAGASPLDAVVYAMTSVSTGGFANSDDSLAGFSGQIVFIVNLLCLAGAVSFHVYYVSVLRLNRSKPFDSQLIALLFMIAFVALLIMVIDQLGFSDLAFIEVITAVISAQTTAGFSTADLSRFPLWMLLLLTAAMFVGGGIGSTSGGIKVGRLLFISSWMRSYFVSTSLPDSAYVDIQVDQQPVTTEDLQEVFAVVGAFVAVLLVSWLMFLIHGYAPMKALFEVTSALTTTGLSSGLTSAELPGVLKTVLCLNMLFGRLEVVALLVVLMPKTWLGIRRRV